MQAEDFKALQRAAWSAAATPWAKWWEVFERGAQSVNDRLVELACIAPGQRVLDIASGLGEPSFTAARRVGPNGLVLGVDFAPDMVARAAARARAMGATQVHFEEHDAERLALGRQFDAALSRWGFMLMPEPVSALRAVRTHVRPDGLLALSWWAEPERVPFLALQARACHELFGAPLPCEELPGPMRFGRSGAMEERLCQAGWTVRASEELTVRLRLASVAEFLTFESDMSSALQKAVEQHGPKARDQALAWLEAHVQPYVQSDGAVHLDSVVRLATAAAS